MKVITIANQKGGVAKTTTAQAFALGLKEHGYKVLVIDLDPQCNLSFAAAADTTLANVYEVFTGKEIIKKVIQSTAQFDIVPGSKRLYGADQQFIRPGREYILKKALNTVRNLYDFIIIDTSPTLGILTMNAFTASNELIVPIGTEIFSYQGVIGLVEMYRDIKESCNPKLVLDGLLATKYNPRTLLSGELLLEFEKIAKQIETKVYFSKIREGIAIREAQAKQKSVLDLINNKYYSTPAMDYRDFVDEYLCSNH